MTNETSTLNTVTDPVCGMTVSQDKSKHHKHNEQDFYFCSDSCLKKFSTNPSAYTEQNK